MERCSLLLELHLDDFLCVIPRTAGIRHEDRLIETEDCDRYQVADEEVRLDESEPKRSEEHGQEDVEHAFLCVLRAYLDDFLAVGDRRFLRGLEIDVRL